MSVRLSIDMGESAKVRFSRDGDQFHYLWAARRCLRLLNPTSGLVAVTIEGPSVDERSTSPAAEEGEEIIDVGEYYGSETIAQSTLIRYIQLKHSTQTPDKHWTMSGLEKSLRGFSARYKAIKADLGVGDLTSRLEMIFATNRPISLDVIETIDDAAHAVESRHPNELLKIETFTGLKDDALASFCKLIRLEGGHDSYRLQRETLALETRSYLPGDDVDAPVQLKELVTRKALSESQDNPSIKKIDVLRVLGTTEDRIFPGPSRIEQIVDAVPREQEKDLVCDILAAAEPVIIRAAGGVGKTILSQRIGMNLPPHSVVVVYDCFANGEYRRAATPRHRHKDALVQIANELAMQGLCDPLIPSSTADNADYLRAFIYRLKQSVLALRSESADAVLCLAIDAAGNAEMAAREFGQERSFVRDLLRIEQIDGLRLVAFCRPEREVLLAAPAGIKQLNLEPFSRNETAQFLRVSYPQATDHDVHEFHRLTSHNPRLQATALAQGGPLAGILRSLGPNPTTVDDAIASLLKKAIAELRDKVGTAEQAQIDTICAALATLRPLVPISVLASVSGVPASAVESFALDLGRPLLVIDGAVQFRDEPVETWFRQEFRPDGQHISDFVAALIPLASDSSYVAATLPQLMLEAGQLNELVELALSSSGLPDGSPVQKRDIELHRLQFALKASLRARSYVAAAKLAMKAGEETAGETRQLKLLQENTDIAATLLAPNNVQELVSRRVFGGGWIGSHHAYEAGLLSYVSEFRGDALSRARMAYEWLNNWSRLPKGEREKERIDDQDIAELAMVALNIDGPEACSRDLGRWSPKGVAFRCGRIVAQRLIDHGKFDVIDKLSLAAKDNIFLFCAINLEYRSIFRYPPKESVERAWKLARKSKTLKIGQEFDYKETDISAAVALAESVCHYAISDNETVALFLDRYLPQSPPYNLTSRYNDGRAPFLRAYALRSALRGAELNIIDLARPEMRKEIEQDKGHGTSQELRDFQRNIGALLPWHKLRTCLLVASSVNSDIATMISKARGGTSEVERSIYREDNDTSDEIAGLWFEALSIAPDATPADYASFISWSSGLKRPLFTPTLIAIARVAARRPDLNKYAHGFAQRAFGLINESKEDAESKADTFINICRALYCFDRLEAEEYFNRAVEVASKFGDEVVDRWQAMIDLADRAADPHMPKSKVAYEFSRCAEVIYEYMARDKHFDWDGTVKAIADLCPSSCFGILSRWRDRQFGWPERLLAEAVQHLLRVKRLEPRLSLGLISFRARWEYRELLQAALPAFSSQSERQQALDHVLQYVRLNGSSESAWKEIEAEASAHGLQIPDIDELKAFAQRSEIASRGESDGRDYGRAAKDPAFGKKDWDAIFKELELHSSQGIAEALKRFGETDPPYLKGIFFEELFSRAPEGRAAETILSISELAELRLYDYREILEGIPAVWRDRHSVRSALTDMAKRVAERHCLDITKSRFYRHLPVELIPRLTGMPEVEFIAIVIEALAERHEVFDSGRLFTLVGLLAINFTHEQAQEALDFGLELFAGTLNETDGDGIWSEALMPPADLGAAVAGYVWGGLAAPKATLRWEAAHAVRGLSAVGASSALSHLVELAERGTGGAFADQKLHFYNWHARLWLMISLARISIGNASALLPYKEFLLNWALRREPHVLIRHFAAECALRLVESGVFSPDLSVISSLKLVNQSPYPIQQSKRYGERNKHDGGARDLKGAKRFTFDYDMRRSCFESLGACFAMSSDDVESAAEKVICDQWQLSENGHWDSDGRARRGFFQGLSSYRSSGTHSRIDSLNFYLSYHSMLTVAGEWLATVPMHQDPDDQEDEFKNWLGRHLLHRSDGRWLSDRRDPPPKDWPTWKDGKQDENWRWSVVRRDFDRVLNAQTGSYNLWGNWVYISGSFEESIHIRSALVTRDRSAALVRALQTVTNPHDYGIPDADDELEIDAGPFRMRGWIERQHSGEGLDKFDPWAGDINYPPHRPAHYVRELLQLDADKEGRIWRSTIADAEGSISVQVWGSLAERDDESEYEHGHRVQVSEALLSKLLSASSMDLIVKVEIDRRKHRSRYDSYNDDGFGYVPGYFKVFCFGANGRLAELR